MSKYPNNQPLLSVVIPLYCEGANLERVLQIIFDILGSLNEPYELILIDDGSTDNTWAIIESESQKFPILRALKLSRNFGKEAALCAGLEMARGQAVIVMDGDLQHPPQLIPEMVKIWHEQKADVVEAVKKERGREKLTSKVGSRLFYTILNALSGYDLKGASDYKLMDRKVVGCLAQDGRAQYLLSWHGCMVGF